ncbi:hypothetical protein TNCV_759431 [Trichonephila clavipes]|nr:hypothetical protein TNCV_759431 [Trichonephila clavipes]
MTLKIRSMIVSPLGIGSNPFISLRPNNLNTISTDRKTIMGMGHKPEKDPILGCGWDEKKKETFSANLLGPRI